MMKQFCMALSLMWFSTKMVKKQQRKNWRVQQMFFGVDLGEMGAVFQQTGVSCLNEVCVELPSRGRWGAEAAGTRYLPSVKILVLRRASLGE